MTRRSGFWQLLARTFTRRCPACGRGPLFRTYFTPAERCPACGFVYSRGNEYGQEGYFTGAMAILMVITGVVPLVVLVVLAITVRLSLWELLFAGVAWTILFPIVCYPYACALWIALDHTLHPPTPDELAGTQPVTETASPLAASRRRHHPGQNG